MKISIEIPDVEIKQSFATILMYMEPSEDETMRYKAKLKEMLDNGELPFDISIFSDEDQKKLKTLFGLMVLEEVTKEDKK